MLEALGNRIGLREENQVQVLVLEVLTRGVRAGNHLEPVWKHNLGSRALGARQGLAPGGDELEHLGAVRVRQVLKLLLLRNGDTLPLGREHLAHLGPSSLEALGGQSLLDAVAIGSLKEVVGGSLARKLLMLGVGLNELILRSGVRVNCGSESIERYTRLVAQREVGHIDRGGKGRKSVARLCVTAGPHLNNPGVQYLSIRVCPRTPPLPVDD